MAKAGKILVTGATGFTGQALCRALSNSGWMVHGLTQSGRQSMAACTLHQADLTDSHSLTRVLETIRPDQIVHLAAKAFVGSSDNAAFYTTNVIGTCNLLEASRSVGIKRAIVVSSANVYGVPKDDSAITEEVWPAPVNHYAASKLAMEHLARTYTSSFPVVITRPFNYTGPGQDISFLVPKLVKHFLDRAPSIELGNLDVFRDFTSIDDVVSAYLSLVASDVDSTTLNICSGTAVSLGELIACLERLSGHRIEVKSVERFSRQNEIPVLLGSNEKIKSLLGWDITKKIEDILADMLEKGR